MPAPVWHCFHLEYSWQVHPRQWGLDGSSARGQHQCIVGVALLCTSQHMTCNNLLGLSHGAEGDEGQLGSAGDRVGLLTYMSMC